MCVLKIEIDERLEDEASASLTYKPPIAGRQAAKPAPMSETNLSPANTESITRHGLHCERVDKVEQPGRTEEIKTSSPLLMLN